MTGSDYEIADRPWWTTVPTGGHAQEVIPLEDLHDHTYKTCLCGPAVRFKNSSAYAGVFHLSQIRVHHAADGRPQPLISNEAD